MLVWAKWPCHLQAPKQTQYLQDVHRQFMFPEELAGEVFPIFYDLHYQTDPKQKHLSLYEARLCNPSRITSKGTEKSLLYTALFFFPEGDSFNKSVKLLIQCFHNGARAGEHENCFQSIQLRLCRCLLAQEGRSSVPGEQVLQAVGWSPELSGSSGLRDDAGTPDHPQLGTARGHRSSKHYTGPEQNDGQSCCLHH